MDAPMPAELADSVFGQRIAFFLAHLRDRAAGASDDELAANFEVIPPDLPLPQRRMSFQHFGQAIGDFRVTGYERPAPRLVVGLADDARGRHWRLPVLFADWEPRRMRFASAFPLPPPGVTLRRALPDDAPALRAIERRCPVVAGPVRTWFDHGDDYFAGERLMGGADAIVVERNGEVVGVHSTVTHPLRIHGRVWLASYLHRTRILPEAQGGGLFGSLNGAGFERSILHSDMGHSYVAEGNEASLRMVPFPPWRTSAERLIIDTRAQTGSAAGREATAADATHIAVTLTRAHGTKELFMPCTADDVTDRLTREPAAYSWSHLLLGDRAVVGVWDARLGVVREDDSGRREAVRGLVLDYGAEPGAEAELIALLRAWCGRLAASGTTELSLFTSAGDPARAALLPLASRVDRYHVCIAVPEPPDIGERGLYVDQLYF